MKNYNEEKRLEALRKYDIMGSEAEAQFDALTQLASYICETPVSLITLLDSDRQWFKSKVGTDLSESARSVSFCHYAIQQAEVYEVENMLKNELFKDNPFVVQEPKIRFYAGAPLQDGEGNNLGTLCVLDTVPKKLSDTQRKSLQVLAEQVMAQIELRKHQRNLKEEIELKTQKLRLHLQELEEAQKELDHQKHFLRKVIDTSPNLIYVKDKNGVFKMANHAVAELYNASTEEVEGKTDKDFNPHADEVEFFIQKDMEVIEKGNPYGAL